MTVIMLMTYAHNKANGRELLVSTNLYKIAQSSAQERGAVHAYLCHMQVLRYSQRFLANH